MLVERDVRDHVVQYPCYTTEETSNLLEDTQVDKWKTVPGARLSALSVQCFSTPFAVFTELSFMLVNNSV